MTCYGRWNWRRWRLWGWLEPKLYTLGIIYGGQYGGCKTLDCPGHPRGWGVVTKAYFDFKTARPYVLGWMRDEPRWVHRLRTRHWPNFYFFSGGLFKPTACGICAPWPCCGSPNEDHTDTCEDDLPRRQS